jgi:hypothetical protein
VPSALVVFGQAEGFVSDGAFIDRRTHHAVGSLVVYNESYSGKRKLSSFSFLRASNSFMMTSFGSVFGMHMNVRLSKNGVVYSVGGDPNMSLVFNIGVLDRVQIVDDALSLLNVAFSLMDSNSVNRIISLQ